MDIMKNTMLKPVCERAGLGCPAQQFTTNPSEAINSVINTELMLGHERIIMYEQTKF